MQGIPEAECRERVATLQGWLVEQDMAGLIACSGPRHHIWGQTGHVGYLSNWANLDRSVDVAVVLARSHYLDVDDFLLREGRRADRCKDHRRDYSLDHLFPSCWPKVEGSFPQRH